MSSAEKSEMLLDRLKRIKAESDAVAEATAAGIAESQLLSKDFGHLASIALKMAKTELIKEGDMEASARLDQRTIVPDGVIADAHNNEVNLSGFVRLNLPERDWPKFIGPED
ncbi:hypothetical protein HGB25_00655 [Candidatus Saccharibacteria bacterium]|nr:hypothetical protein [Candidatus Saccharibacteria bacterium]